MPVRARTRRAVLFLSAAFVLRGIFLNLALPYGDPLDEIFHFGYAVFLEATGHPPATSEISIYASTFAAVARRGGYPPSAGPDGWYLLILFPVLLAAGCARGRRIPSETLLIAFGIFVVAEGLLTLGVLPAVYSGWTTPNGSNAPLQAWLPMATSPFLALATYARVGLGRAPLVVLAAILAAQLLALVTGTLSALWRRPLGP